MESIGRVEEGSFRTCRDQRLRDLLRDESALPYAREEDRSSAMEAELSEGVDLRVVEVCEEEVEELHVTESARNGDNDVCKMMIMMMMVMKMTTTKKMTRSTENGRRPIYGVCFNFIDPH